MALAGFSKSEVEVLPSHFTVTKLWKDYCGACVADGVAPRCRTVFRQIWKAVLPMLMISKPSSDLCWTCQQYIYNYAR